jgi:hypothetical protein
MARIDSRPVAGNVYFVFGKRAVYKFGASDENAQEFRGSNLACGRESGMIPPRANGLSVEIPSQVFTTVFSGNCH